MRGPALILVFAVCLSGFSIQESKGQENDRLPDAADSIQSASTLRVYRLNTADPDSIARTLLQLQFDEPVRITADERTRALVVLASPASHEMIQTILEILDVPVAKRQPDLKMISLKGSVESVRTVASILSTVTPGVTLTVDTDRELLILSADDKEALLAAQLVISQLEEFEREHAGDRDTDPPKPFMLRFVWLETGLDNADSRLMTNDLIDAVAPLESVGVTGLGVVAQGILQVGTGQPEIASEFEGLHSRRFAIDGTPHPDSFDIQLTADEGSKDETEMTARVSLQPGQWVVLGAVGSSEHQKVFAVQRMKD